MNLGYLLRLWEEHLEIHSCLSSLLHLLLEGHLGSHSYLQHHLMSALLLHNCYQQELILQLVAEVRKQQVLYSEQGLELLILRK